MSERCLICGWPMAESVEKGCVPGICSYRPEQGSEEWHRIQRRRRELEPSPSSPVAVPPADCGADRERELDAKIARLVMGWRRSPTRPFWIDDGSVATEPLEWSPSRCLNACFEAQAVLMRKLEYQGRTTWEGEGAPIGAYGFIQALKRVIMSERGTCDDQDLTVATAEQRCRAMLKAAQASGVATSQPTENAAASGPRGADTIPKTGGEEVQ